jgi:hypothetical protein
MPPLRPHTRRFACRPPPGTTRSIASKPGVAAALGRDAAARAEPVVNAWRTSPPRGCSGYHLQGLAGHHGAAPEPCLQEGHAWGGHAPQRLVMTEV